jgi:hypothetical protein
MNPLTSGIIQGAMILIGKLIAAGLEIRKSRKQIVMVVPCPREVYDEDKFLRRLDEYYDQIDYNPILEELTLTKGGTYREKKRRIPARMIKQFLKTHEGWSEKKVACTKATLFEFWSEKKVACTKATLFEFAKWMRER